MIDVRAWLANATMQLGARAEAEMLLLHVARKPRSWLFAHSGDALPVEVQAAADALVERRARGEPVAYITGRRGFWTLDLDVTPATLIPRVETELLVELALARLPINLPLRVADLGTGSGAIALSIAGERPRTHVLATDVSGDALAVARRNAQRLGFGNLRFAQGDWLAPLADECFDLVVSNPPYIETGDPHLGQGDLRYEPTVALTSGADGLAAIRHIVAGAGAHLVPGGWLLFEHGWQQGDVARALLDAAGFTRVFTAQDAEARDRVSGGARRA
ncbi:MAG TPA: peptide chain release factor N(5)-glutamine methyltransferase [Rhodanobacter sp.]|nr:peptide chain release factor N(5)-glutamine methyltransferase [Rhodanobacter sp.]